MPPRPTTARAAQSIDGPVAILRFLPAWREQIEGQIVQGGALRIQYTAERTIEAFSGPDGLTPPNIEAHLTFEPGGQHLVGSVAADFEVPVPDDAEQLALYFQATDRNRTTHWDSRYGENYRYPVVPSGQTPKRPRATRPAG
jgi:hypothetical protein